MAEKVSDEKALLAQKVVRELKAVAGDPQAEWQSATGRVKEIFSTLTIGTCRS